MLSSIKAPAIEMYQICFIVKAFKTNNTYFQEFYYMKTCADIEKASVSCLTWTFTSLFRVSIYFPNISFN